MISVEGYENIEKKSQSSRYITYSGMQSGTLKPVIIKYFPIDTISLSFNAQLTNEYELAKRINSEHVAKIFSLEKIYDQKFNGLLFIIENPQGISLKEYSLQKKIITREFLDISIQIAKGLKDIHITDIIHSEINPNAIVIDAASRKVKIKDFGFNAITDYNNIEIHNFDIIENILRYISPEMTGYTGMAIDYRSDFYSLGITMYELLLGRLPFKSRDPLEIIHAHIAKRPTPPVEEKSNIPQIISNIIMKLISKNPEDRYQSAHGIIYDLEQCLEKLKSDNSIEMFTLGYNDISDKFMIPQKIYGRTREMNALLSIFDKARQGSSGCMFVKGFAGIGKTMLVREIQRPVIQNKGYFISGKFDILSRDIPDSAIVQAFKELMRQILSESEERNEIWENSLLDALGQNGRIITDLIPDSESLIGRQPEIPDMDPEESQNRFNIVFKNFVRIFAKEEHPLVIFLDNLQWADSASLNLIKTMMDDSELKYIFFIASYRDNEITESHPLALWLKEIENSNIDINAIFLKPLGLTDVTQMIAGTLKSDYDTCGALAELVYQKSGGNPFFVKQFLRLLYEDRMLTFSAESGWSWDLNRIKKMQATDNVIELMIEKIGRQKDESRDLLKYASIIGSRFKLEMIADIFGKPANEILSGLNESIRNDLIIQTITDYRFSHDRIHEAVYSMISEKERKELHYRIGNYMLQSIKNEEISEIIFHIVDHINNSLELISDEREKIKIASLNLSAGKKAKSRGAYISALKYLEHAIFLLPENVWDADYDLAFSIFMEKAESEYLSGNFLQEEIIFEVILKNVKNNYDRAKVYSLLVVQHTHQNRIDEAINLGIDAIKLFNLKLSATPGMLSIYWELFKVRRALKKRKIEDLINNPELEDHDKLIVMELLIKLTVPAYFSSKASHRKLSFLIILKMLNISLKYGNSKYSSYVYVAYGIMIGRRYNDYKESFILGKLGIALNEKFNNIELKAKVYHMFGGLICVWNRPFDKFIDYLTTAFQSGMMSGDFLFTAYAIASIFFQSIRKGIELNHLLEIYNTHLNFMKLTRYAEINDIFTIFYRMILLFKGQTHGNNSYSDDSFDEIEMIKRNEENHFVLYFYYLFKVESLYLFRNYSEALKFAFKMYKYADKIFYAIIPLTEFYFYFSLSLTAIFKDTGRGERKRYLKILKIIEKKFKIWADNCPENFLHQYLLIRAELLRIKGHKLLAMEYYNRAIISSQKNGYINHQAIAYELFAKFYLDMNNEITAKALIINSYNCYKEWGADAKVLEMEIKFADIIKNIQKDEAILAKRHINYSSIVNSLQAISSEIIPEELLKKLMKIALENAGAERGFFLSIQGNDIFIEAEAIMGDKENFIIKSIPLNKIEEILIPVINYVKRTMKHVIINDARKEGNYRMERYIINKKPLSILCLPVIRQSKLIGILYMENNTVTGAFTPEHIEILQILASKAAISLEIARLHDKLTHEAFEHFKVEEALRDSEDRYRLVVETMNEGIVLLDGSSLLRYVNSRFCEMIGYTNNEIIGRPLADFLDKESRGILRQQLLRRRKGEHESYEINIVRKDNRKITTVVSPRPIFDSDGSFEGSFGIFTDVTEKIKMEEDLLKASKLESLGVFAGGIAHDFNNLLTAITGNISLVKLNLTEEDKDFDILSEAENASLRAKDLTQQLLTFSRGGEPIKKTTSIKKLLYGTIDFALSGSNVICEYSIQDDLWNAEIDEGQISQVIQNVVINAIQAMSEGGTIRVAAKNVIIDEKLKLPLRPGNYIRMDIADQGTGIAPEHQKYIFDPYFTTKEDGSGLGLTVSYSIIEKHGGYIMVDSEVGAGTTFIIFFPASKVHIPLQEPKELKDVTAKGKILLMDDDEAVLKVAGNMLGHLGIETELARHGEEAIDLYIKSIESGCPFDLVIMDLTIPGKMGGKETITRLKAINPSVKAVVSSGYSNDPVMANFNEYGFSGVVAKPYRIEDLRAVINNVLSKE